MTTLANVLRLAGQVLSDRTNPFASICETASLKSDFEQAAQLASPLR